MSDINFLDNQRRGEDEELKDKANKKEKLIWSNPEKEAASPKNSAFSFLPFTNKPKSADKKPASLIDKNKIKQSRKEILSLIKRHENSKTPLKVSGKSFLGSLREKFKEQPAPKEVLIDYQRIFNREKEHKEQIGKVFNVKPAAESSPAAIEKSKNNWFNRLKELFKSKITATDVRRPNKAVETIKPPQAEKARPVPPVTRAEKKPVEAKEIKIQEPAPAPKNEIRRRVLETNLIQRELVTFFDWRSKIVILAASILAPLAIVGAVYYGLDFYQKSSQAKNSARVQKFAELGQEISREEVGLKEVLAFQSTLKTVSEIFAQHLYWTNFFKFLEDNTIKDVYFKDFQGDTSGNYVLDATAANYGNIAEQVKVFRDNKKITAVSVNGGELAAGDDKNKSLVKFIFDFSVLKNIFTE